MNFILYSNAYLYVWVGSFFSTVKIGKWMGEICDLWSRYVTYITDNSHLYLWKVDHTYGESEVLHLESMAKSVLGSVTAQNEVLYRWNKQGENLLPLIIEVCFQKYMIA
jgi:hypothetical protein